MGWKRGNSINDAALRITIYSLSPKWCYCQPWSRPCFLPRYALFSFSSMVRAGEDRASNSSQASESSSTLIRFSTSAMVGLFVGKKYFHCYQSDKKRWRSFLLSGWNGNDITCLFKVDILRISMMFEFLTMDTLAWNNKTSCKEWSLLRHWTSQENKFKHQKYSENVNFEDTSNN